MKSKRPYFFGASLKTIDRTKKLRRDSTNAELLLWKVIRNRQLRGFKFRRQHTICHFIVDFYCHEGKLIIELDGDIHEVSEVKEYDAKREAILKELELKILRFTNEDVFSNLDKVIKTIEECLRPP